MDHSPLVNFGPFTFDRTRMVLRRDGCLIPLGGRGAAILATLVDAKGQVVTRAELLQAVWRDQPIEERNLTVQIAMLRQALGTYPNGDDPIRTVPRAGYHLALHAPPVPIRDLLPSVAVFPFANLSGDPALAFFANGVSEDIIAALSRFRSFAVIARASSFASMAGGATATEAAFALNVRYILEGSVQREGRRLRLAARLTDTTGTVLWADHFEEALGGVFEMQDRITAAVVSLAEPQITGAEIARSRRKQPENLDAYDHFLQGVALIGHQGEPVAYLDAMVHHLDRAVALDPSFPQALAFAGFAHDLRRSFGGATGVVDDFAITIDLCHRALEKAPDDSLVLAIGGLERHGLLDDGEGGIAMVERALGINPHSYHVVDLAATVHTMRNNPDRAIQLHTRCLRLNPLPPFICGSLEGIAICHLNAGRYGAAEDFATRAIPAGGWSSGLVTLAVAQALLGQVDDARGTLARYLALRPGATIREMMDRLTTGTRNAVEAAWTEGLRRAGLPEG